MSHNYWWCSVCGNRQEIDVRWDLKCTRCADVKRQLSPDVVEWVKDVVDEALRRYHDRGDDT